MQQAALCLLFMSMFFGFAIAAVSLLVSYSETSDTLIAAYLRKVL